MGQFWIRSRSIALLLTVLTALPVALAASSEEKAESSLRPPTRVRAQIEFVDDGTTLTISGRAKRMTPGEVYVSLIYDIDSFVDGPGACEPEIFDPTDPFFILPTMFIGFWNVDDDGDGTLNDVDIAVTDQSGQFTGERVRVPLNKIGTVSVRRLLGPIPGPGEDPPPTIVEACGEVFEAAEADDDDSDSDSD